MKQSTCHPLHLCQQPLSHRVIRLAPLALAITMVLSAQECSAAESAQYFNIPTQTLSAALNSYADATDLPLSYPAALANGITSPGVTGKFTSEQALHRILAGSGLRVQNTENGTLTLVKEGVSDKVLPPQNSGDNAITLDKVKVTASELKQTRADTAEQEDDSPFNTRYNRSKSSTATKTDSSILESPVSIQVVPRALLSDKQSITLPDAVNGHVSGVLGRTGGGYLYDNFIIRGLSGSGFGDAYRNGLFNRQDIYDIANIEQIDILKGPAAMLYGRIEPGGMVNYVTKRALDYQYYSLQKQFGSFDQYRTLIDATGPIDKAKTLLYRFNGSYTNTESFREFVGNERFFVAPAFTWRPNNKFESHFDLEYKHDRLNSDYGIPAINGRPADIPITRSLKDGFQRQLAESTLVGIDWTYRFNDNWKLTQRYLFKDWSLTGPTLFNYGGIQSDMRTLKRSSQIAGQDVMTHSGNIDLNGKFEVLGSKHNLLIGVDGFKAKTEAVTKGGTGSTIDIYNPVYGQINFDAFTKDTAFFYRKESWIGVYVQDQISLFNRLHLLLGGRYDNVVTGANFSAETFDAAIAGRKPQSDDAFSPRAGILYQVQDWLSVYGSYTKSFSGNNGQSANNEKFDPQIGKQYEIGIKTETTDKRFSSTLAFFHLTKSNLLTDDPNQADPNFQILAGKIRSKGIELDVAGQVTDRLQLLLTYAFTQANYVEDHDGLMGKRLENIPRHQGSLWGTWQFNDAFKAGLGVVTVGKRFGDPDNTFYMPGYVRLDAMAAYTYRIGQHRLTAQLNINNLLDKTYYVNSDGSNLGAIPGAPINVLGSLKYEF